ncbi:MAG: DUF1579 domain-containing protein [Mojavia pulchra JT2-VF2]|uniref:DUF1579 domain-containing protein n=1 Tax=Mojavia pulchra JT2-VF2 TaxID=287848 RepID=A0A951UKH5_9NOST|nr:DUF1579 domain-containing protein [Mojavia pulchra JT2-VF2]
MENVRSFGGLWVLAKDQGEMPDGCVKTTLMALGYDVAWAIAFWKL